MDLELDGLTALVTGANGGIGRALAECFAAEGARLVLHAHTSGEALASWVGTRPWADRALCVQADVTEPAEVQRAFGEGEARFGRVDLAIANAGWWPSADEPLHEASLERVRRAVSVNLLGAAWTARAWMAGLARSGPRTDGRGAALVLIGSTAGRFGERGHADYAMAKAGLRGLVLSLKNEVVRLDPYARVNLVEPGWTVTPMAEPGLAVPGAITRVVRTMSLRQLARPEDVARAVAVLASPGAGRHLSGEALTVAGGMEGRVQWEEGETEEGRVKARSMSSPAD